MTSLNGMTQTTGDLTQLLACDSQCGPSVTVNLKNMTRTAGSIVRWYCKGDQDDLDYKWYKDGVLLQGVRGYSEIFFRHYLILNAQTSDNGWYTCEIGNEYGSVNTSAYFQVIGRVIRSYLIPFCLHVGLAKLVDVPNLSIVSNVASCSCTSYIEMYTGLMLNKI